MQKHDEPTNQRAQAPRQEEGLQEQQGLQEEQAQRQPREQLEEAVNPPGVPDPEDRQNPPEPQEESQNLPEAIQLMADRQWEYLMEVFGVRACVWSCFSGATVGLTV